MGNWATEPPNLPNCRIADKFNSAVRQRTTLATGPGTTRRARRYRLVLAALPVTRLSVQMHYPQYKDFARLFRIKNPVGKPVNKATANLPF